MTDIQHIEGIKAAFETLRKLCIEAEAAGLTIGLSLLGEGRTAFPAHDVKPYVSAKRNYS